MNASKTRKFIWWSHGANATRSTAGFFRDIFSDFYNYHPGEDLKGSPSHEFDIPKGCEDFVIVSNVRNPFTLSVSSFKDILEQYVNEGKDLPNFEEWVYSLDKIKASMSDDIRWSVVNRMPDYFIRMESLEEDLVNLPFVQSWLSEDTNNNVILENALNNHIRLNCYINENPYDKYKDGFQDIRGLYTQEIADKVIELFNPVYFEKIGYDIDSWKSN